MASRGVCPSSRCASSAKSIIMIAFFLTMPISSTMPMMAMMSRSSPASSRASSAPTPAEGSVDRMVTGWMVLS
ncbi:Secreted protein [Delftia tsuruhatensis]